jgi:hypothetical protein
MSFRALSRSNKFPPDSAGQLELLMTQERAKTREKTRMDFKVDPRTLASPRAVETVECNRLESRSVIFVIRSALIRDNPRSN